MLVTVNFLNKSVLYSKFSVLLFGIISKDRLYLDVFVFEYIISKEAFSIFGKSSNSFWYVNITSNNDVLGFNFNVFTKMS